MSFYKYIVSFLLILTVSTGCSSYANVDKLFENKNEYLIKLYGFSNNDYITIEKHLIKLSTYKNHKLVLSTSLKKDFTYETYSSDSSQINKDITNILQIIDIDHHISYENNEFSIKSKNIRFNK